MKDNKTHNLVASKIMKPVVYLFFLAVLCVPHSSVRADTDFAVGNHKGKVVYVDFWASWCTPCRASFPFMKDMAEKYGDSLIVVAINVDKNREDADNFLGQYDVNFDIVYDPTGKLAEEFQVSGMPTSYLYDRKGQLIGSHIGFRVKDIQRLEAAIKDALENEK